MSGGAQVFSDLRLGLSACWVGLLGGSLAALGAESGEKSLPLANHTASLHDLAFILPSANHNTCLEGQ